MYSDLKMPWGKYKNKYICDIPSSYLLWLAENCDQDYIATAASDEWIFRERYNTHKGED